MGSGSLCMFPYVFHSASCLFQYSFFNSVQTGSSVRECKTFEEFMGPAFKNLKEKYWEWLTMSYSAYDSTDAMRHY